MFKASLREPGQLSAGSPRAGCQEAQAHVYARVIQRPLKWSDVQTLRHMFLIIPDSNNIMVEEFRVISRYQRAPLFIVASLGGLMGLKPLGAPDLKSNYAHCGEWFRQMECFPAGALCKQIKCLS